MVVETIKCLHTCYIVIMVIMVIMQVVIINDVKSEVCWR